jgi:hypothetical protein
MIQKYQTFFKEVKKFNIYVDEYVFKFEGYVFEDKIKKCLEMKNMANKTLIVGYLDISKI